MELSALRSLASAFSSPSSSTSSHDSRHEHRHRHKPRRATTEEEEDDVYHRHRKNRQKSFERRRERRHTNSTEKSMSSSRVSSGRSSRKESDEMSLASTCDDRPGLNLPLDKEFLPLDSTTQDERAEQEQEEMRDQVICMIFDLPESTQFYQDFSCAIASTLAMHGRMYPTSSHVCFYSNVFGRERKVR